MSAFIEGCDYVVKAGRDLVAGQIVFLHNGVPALVAEYGEDDEDRKLVFVLIQRALNETLARGTAFYVPLGERYLTLEADGVLAAKDERTITPATEMEDHDLAVLYGESGLLIEAKLHRQNTWPTYDTFYCDFAGTAVEINRLPQMLYLKNPTFVWRTGADSYITL